MRLDLQTQTQFYLGLFERELHPWLTRLSAGVRSVVDIGAAQGEYSLFALLKTKAERVIAFEPAPDMLGQLWTNIDANDTKSDRFQLHAAALGATDRPGSVSVESLARSILAPCLLKMDIDGGEAEVLRAGSGLLQLEGLRWIIETHSVSLEKECLAILSSHGYATRIVPNAWWRAAIPEQRVSEQNRWVVAATDHELVN